MHPIALIGPERQWPSPTCQRDPLMQEQEAEQSGKSQRYVAAPGLALSGAFGLQVRRCRLAGIGG